MLDVEICIWISTIFSEFEALELRISCELYLITRSLGDGKTFPKEGDLVSVHYVVHTCGRSYVFIFMGVCWHEIFFVTPVSDYLLNSKTWGI